MAVKKIVNKKDIFVEILRIMACFLVITYHTKSYAIDLSGNIKKDVLLLWTICAPCVITFFLISGFYMYDKKGKTIDIWIKLIKNFIFKFLIPSLILALFCIIFDKYFLYEDTFANCILNIDIYSVISRLFNGLLHFDVTIWSKFSAHLWYIFAYAWIIICYPITKYVLNLNKKYRNIIIIFFLILMLLNDITVLYDNWYLAIFFVFMQKPVIYSACGYILMHDIIPYFKKLDIKYALLNTFSIYVLSLIYMYMMQYKFFMTYGSNDNYVFGSWQGIGSLFMTSAIIITIKLIADKIKFNNIWEKLILNISDATFGIFIIHYPIVGWLITRKIEDKAMKILQYNVLTEILYVVFYNLFIFIISYILVIIYKRLKNILYVRRA